MNFHSDSLKFFFCVCEFKSLQLPCWSRSHRADLRGVRDSATCTGVHVRRGQRCCLAMLNLGVGGYCADWSLPCLRTGPWRSSEHFIECEEAEEDHSSQKRHVEEIIVVVDRLG